MVPSPKQLRSQPRITIAERRFKRYHVNADGSPIAAEVQEAAYSFVLVGCIWELAALGHEPAAWVRHVFGAEEPDVHAYLADVLPDGPVGDGTR